MPTYISIPEFEGLSALAQARYQAQIKTNGKVTNMKKTLLHSVPAFDALMTWYPLYEGVEKMIGKRAAIFYAYAISDENECLICSAFFIKILKELDITFETFAFSDTENLLIEYGRALVKSPHSIDSSLLTALKTNFSEADIVLLTSFAGLMIATNLINTALKVPLDEYLFEYIPTTTDQETTQGESAHV